MLVAAVCDETCVGMNEGVYDHMWIVHDPMEGTAYESGEYECRSDLRAACHRLDSIKAAQYVGHQLLLEYDYGSTSTYQLVLKSVDELAEDDDKAQFPRRAPLPGQADFVPYNPGPDAANLNEIYFDLNRFLFDKDDDNLELYLFQPGKKKVQGFIRKEYDACAHMIHLPDKFGDVDEMLAALEQSIKADTPSMRFEWFGATVFPRNCTSNRLSKYMDSSSDGLDITVERGGPNDQKNKGAFLKTFPKTAAAAGFNKNGKPSKANERGWIVYRNGTLTVCRGNSKTIKSNAPSPGVFDGANKHEPENDAVVGKMNIEVNSLQELFCAAEALW